MSFRILFFTVGLASLHVSAKPFWHRQVYDTPQPMVTPAPIMPTPDIMQPPGMSEMASYMSSMMSEASSMSMSMMSDASASSSSMMASITSMASMYSSDSMMPSMTASPSDYPYPPMSSDYPYPPMSSGYPYPPMSSGDNSYASMTWSSAYPMPTGGGGGMGPNGDLQSCIQTCQAQFGGSTTTSQISATSTHTVIVAPTKGVLRYVPFAVNANPGDAIEYIWGAGPHTVTSSDGLNICNKSTGPDSFASGLLDASATFEISVPSNETFFDFCTVPTHCQKGMYGVVNPPMAPMVVSSDPSAHTSVGSSMKAWAMKNTTNKAMVNAVENMPGMTPEIWAWASMMDTKPFATVDTASLMMNVLYTRAMFAMNPGMINGTLSANWTAAPDLETLVAQSSATSSIATATAMPSTSSSMGTATSDAGPNGTASIAAAAASQSSSALGLDVPAFVLVLAIGISFIELLI